MNDVWIKVTAVMPEVPEDWSGWCEVFSSHGIEGTIQTDQPPTLSGYLAPGDVDGLDALVDSLRGFGAVDVLREDVLEEDWSEAWKQYFRATRVGERFMIVPTWDEYDPVEGDLVISLDPGQSFGTGDHPTTRGCLVLLEKEGCAGKDVADIGCGSGILSVGAGLLGAGSLALVDVESQSVASAMENLARNGVSGEVFEGRGFDPLSEEATFDLVLSNIISAALIGLAPEAGRRVRPGGAWIVSGIIRDNWGDVQERAERCGFRVEEVYEEGDWVAATLRR